MTHEEVKALVEEMGLPYAYDHFAEGESPDPPFICFLYPRAENFGADNLVYHHFNRLDIEVYTDYKDPDMEAAIEEVLTEHELDLFSLEMFEDLAWLMARHADPVNVPDSPEEFLDQFNTFSIYQILPQLIELWGLNVQTEVESRKNLEKVSGK